MEDIHSYMKGQIHDTKAYTLTWAERYTDTRA